MSASEWAKIGCVLLALVAGTGFGLVIGTAQAQAPQPTMYHVGEYHLGWDVARVYWFERGNDECYVLLGDRGGISCLRKPER